MGRPASPATIIKHARRRVSELEAEVRSLKTQRDTYQAQLVARVREVEEWKKRFDALLKVVPQTAGDNGSQQ